MDMGTVGTVFGVGIALYLVYLLITGLVIGALARFVLPGPDPMSWIATIGYGIAGSLVGGIVGWILRLGSVGFLLAIACAAGLIWFRRRRNKRGGGPPVVPPPG